MLLNSSKSLKDQASHIFDPYISGGISFKLPPLSPCWATKNGANISAGAEETMTL